MGALRGPKDDEELQKLRGLGYDPQQALQVAKSRADEEAAQRLRLDGDGPWRGDRLEDVVIARELLIEFQRMAPLAFQQRGITLERILTSPADRIVTMFASTPKLHPAREGDDDDDHDAADDEHHHASPGDCWPLT